MSTNHHDRPAHAHPEFRLGLALVHYPIIDKAGSKVCTNITNFDVHDIARAGRAYGLERYYLVNPLREQLMFASRMMDHWRTGFASGYNPARSKALSIVRCAETLEKAVADFDPEAWVVGTCAKEWDKSRRTVPELLQLMREEKRSVMLVFGTGFGLHSEILEQCHFMLPPLRGGSTDDYRHLSVRSAVSIYLDRLLGQ
jgi:hypothetical protein